MPSAGSAPGFLLARGNRTDLGDPVGNLRHAVLAAPAVTDPAWRAAAASGGELPERWPSYTTLVRDASYRITDDDIARLAAAGRSEDEIYEMTAAVGAALRSYDAGLRAAVRGR